ncbi:MAG: hypothetical protein JXR94_03115, partial [Candidatus Hydrogenedentes bacterium]|nr:hypothetical protein [Candidatus Hydrogenedentota bacterium]
IEAALRVAADKGFLFVINHEASSPDTAVALADLPFELAGIVDVADGERVSFAQDSDRIQLNVSVPLGEVRLFSLLPKAGQGRP